MQIAKYKVQNAKCEIQSTKYMCYSKYKFKCRCNAILYLFFAIFIVFFLVCFTLTISLMFLASNTYLTMSQQ